MAGESSPRIFIHSSSVFFLFLFFDKVIIFTKLGGKKFKSLNLVFSWPRMIMRKVKLCPILQSLCHLVSSIREESIHFNKCVINLELLSWVLKNPTIFLDFLLHWFPVFLHYNKTKTSRHKNLFTELHK